MKLWKLLLLPIAIPIFFLGWILYCLGEIEEFQVTNRDRRKEK